MQANLKQYDIQQKSIYYKFLSGTIREIYCYSSKTSGTISYYICNVDFDNGLNLTIDKNQIIMKI